MTLCDEQMARKAQAHESDEKRKKILYIFMFDTHLMLFGYITRTFVYPYGQYAIHILYVFCFYFILSIFFGFYPSVEKNLLSISFQIQISAILNKDKKCIHFKDLLLVGRVPKNYIYSVLNVPYSGRDGYSSEFNGFWCLWFATYLSFLSHIQSITENITVHLWNKQVIGNIREVQKTCFSILALKMEEKSKLSMRFFDFSFHCFPSAVPKLAIVDSNNFSLTKWRVEWYYAELFPQDFKSYTLHNFQIFRLNVFQWGIISVFPFF